jgi:hypothetical protein
VASQNPHIQSPEGQYGVTSAKTNLGVCKVEDGHSGFCCKAMNDTALVHLIAAQCTVKLKHHFLTSVLQPIG